MAPIITSKSGKLPIDRLPVIDISPMFGSDDSARAQVAEEVGAACREYGFFYIKGHGVPDDTINRLYEVSRQFFARPEEEKMEISLKKYGVGGKGYFPMCGEITSGKPDVKEGLYFGVELDDHHPKVQAGFPMHGPNPFPRNPPEMKEVILQYMEETKKVAHGVMEALALSLGLDCNYFRRLYTDDPTTIFGILHYPSAPPMKNPEELWGTGEHTDYGLLTLLLQDDVGGLQVKTQNRWIEGSHVPGTYVCNIGDMLDRLTGGVYRSTPHRVRVNQSGRPRLSFPFFFDPGFDREVVPLPEDTNLPKLSSEEDRKTRWDGVSVHDMRGPYGNYFLSKIAKAFPALNDAVAG